MENILKTIKSNINSTTKITAMSCGIGSVMSLAISKSMGIGCHKHITMPSFSSVLQDLNEYYLDDDFSNHIKVRNENLEYDENDGNYYAYFEVNSLNNILIKATIDIDAFHTSLSFEIKTLDKSEKIIGTLDAAEYYDKDFSVVPIEKHIYDILYYFTMDHYNLYGFGDDLDD